MDIYEVLKQDHIQMKKMLDELTSLRDDDEYRYVLIEEIRNILVPHSRAEESIFYNTLRAVNADSKIVFHGFQEHLESEALLRSLQVMDRMSFSWKKTARKLKEVINHHIEEEENEIFEEAHQAFSKEEAIIMAEAFEQLKPKIENEGLLKNTIDMVVNMMPPRLGDKLRDLGEDRPR